MITRSRAKTFRTRRSSSLAALLLAGTAIAGLPLAAHAQATWKGTTSTNWFTGANWSTNAQPVGATDVVIDTTTPNPTVISGFSGDAKTLILGQNGNAQLTIMSGGSLNVGDTTLGAGSGSSGGLLVTGANSKLNLGSTASLMIGNIGTGVFQIAHGGVATDSAAYIELQGSSASVDGVGSTWNTAALSVGEGGGGALTVTNGGQVSGDTLVVSDGGTAVVAAAGSSLALDGFTKIGTLHSGKLSVISGAAAQLSVIYVGASSATPPSTFSGDGTLAIASSGSVSGYSADVGEFSGYTGAVTVDGTGSSFQLTNGFNLGEAGGSGTLAITNGGVVGAGQTVIGAGAGSTGTASVDGAHSAFDVTGLLIIGSQGGAGSLSLTNGGVAAATEVGLGNSTGGVGLLTVGGAGSAFSTDVLEVGVVGAGTLSVQTGAVVTINSLSIATDTGAQGSATITGPGAALAASHTISIDAGTGAFSVLGGAHVSDSLAIVGQYNGVNATATVAGAGSQWSSQNTLSVALAGTGALTIANGGSVTNVDSTVGAAATASGTVSVTGSGSQWTTTGQMLIGDQGSGTLNIANGATVTAAGASLAYSLGGVGAATIDGAGSLLTVNGAFNDGARGFGTLTLSNGGQVDDLSGAVAGAGGSTATATVSGTNSTWDSTNQLTVGGGLLGGTSKGTLTITTGGAVLDNGADVGEMAGSTGAVIVDGQNSRWLTAQNATIGDSGAGSLMLRNGGLGGASNISVGLAGSGAVTVTDALTHLQVGTDLIVGGGATAGAGTGSLTILNQGLVTSMDGYVGNSAGSTGAVSVDGTGTGWTMSANLIVGFSGTGSLSITNGGLVSSNAGGIGYNPTGVGTAVVDGAGSSWTIAGGIEVGIGGSGKLTLSNGGLISGSLPLYLAFDPGSSGTLVIGADPVNAPAAPGTVNMPSVLFEDGQGSIVFNHTSINYVFAPALLGVGTIRQVAGVTVLTGDATQYGGAVTVQGGTLLVNDALGTGSGSVFVQSGGALGGTGTISAPVSIAGGGTLIGVQGQTLTMDSLILGGAATVNVSLGAPGGAGLFSVTHDLTLGGTLNIGSQAGFGPGVYRLFDYGGTLTDNGLSVGSTPVGTQATDFAVQTSVPFQVNLVDTAVVTNNFWDGDAPGNAANGKVDGGSGTWSTLSTNFTGINGAANGPMAPQPGFAIFEGAPGPVSVDNSHGFIEVSGMQFASDGYRITGEPIILTDAASVIRVGDGTAAGAGYTATIDASLTGQGGLDKTDLGTLVLTGHSHYSGNTLVDQGVLQLSGGGTVSDSSAVVGFAAGSSAAAIVTGAGSTWNHASVFVVGDLGAATLTISAGGTVNDDIGEVAGGSTSASVVVDGAGSSWNNASDDIIGGFETGTLSIQNGGAVNDGTGMIGAQGAGVGVVTVTGSGSTWTLTGDLVVAGYNLQMETGGTGTLLVQNGGVVVSNDGFVGYQSGSVGAVHVDGAGSSWTNATTLVVGQQGSGTLSLSNGGYVSAPGGVTLAALAGSSGVLNIGGDPAAAAAAPGTLDTPTLTFGAGAGQLNFNHTSGAYVFSAAISGSGVIDQLAGMTHLTADSSGFSGGTTVLGGSLLVDGKLGAGGVMVQGGELGGTGTIGGAVTIASGGGLLGVQGQTLTMDSLTLSGGANVNVTLGAPGAAGLFNVTNNLTLDGVLNISSAAGFGPGVYRLFDYDGALTDNGLDIGAVPGGSTAAGFSVQTSVAHQVNLVSSQVLNLAFWDGDAAGAAGNGKVDGGAGTWRANSLNFTDANGATNGAMTPQPGFAVFEGASGAVTVDASQGAIAVTGIQFATDGYRLSGDSITLANPDSIIRVGDGSAAGAGYAATIGSVLTGAGGLDKTDLGTLILTGANDYSGGTIVAAGVLQLGDGGAGGTGSVVGDIVDNARLVFDNGQLLTNTPGVISGSGSVTVLGLVDLTGANTYTGGTAIAASGVLFIGSSGTTGSVVGDIADDGRLGFARSDNIVFGGVVSGGGDVEQDGTGVLTLTGVNTYTGLTSITQGTLALAGAGSIAASRQLIVESGGVFDISVTSNGAAVTTLYGAGGVTLGAQTLTLTNASDTFTGTIAGTGGLAITAGQEVLAGANTYTGGTQIGPGAILVLGDNGQHGSILGDVADQGLLVFDNPDATSFGGVISGAGGLQQAGGGVTTLTAANTYTGVTNITGGGLALAGGGSIAGPVIDNANFDISATTAGASITSLSGSGSVALGAQTLSLTQANDIFSGTIGGSGGLRIAGGVEVLNGANTYTGGTSIAAGAALEIGDGGVTGSITGDVVTNGALAFDRSDAVTFGGVISGSGAVFNEGAGTTTLSGLNTYSGNTIIDAGTVKGSATSFGSGGVAVTGSLVIDQPTDAAFANTIVGTGSLTKTGAGSLNLTGMNGFTGATTVAAGRLAVNGYLGGSVVTVQAGATLGGNGVVGGVVAQTGATVGPGNSIGLLTVNGDYSQAAGSTYQVELTSAGASDRINVSGKAAIASGAVLNVTKTDTSPYVIGTHYAVLNAAGGVTGSFNLTGDTKVTDFLGLVLGQDGFNVYLDVAKIKTFAQAGGTFNQIATGGGLDSLPATNALVGALANLQTDAAARGAFDQLSGEAEASVKTALLEDGQLVRDAATGRLRSAFGEAGGGVNAVDAGGATFWGQVFDTRGASDGDGNTAKLNRSTDGFLLGGDVVAFNTWRVGLLTGYGHTDLKVGARQSDGGSDDYHLGAYAGTQQGPWGVRLGAAYSRHDVTMGRSVAFAGFSDHLTGAYDAGLAQAFADVGYRIPLGRGAIEPFASVAFESVSTDGFTEHGGLAALRVSGDIDQTVFSTLGLRGSERFVQGQAQFIVRGSVGWRHAYGDVTPTSTAAFAGGTSFTVQGTPVAKDGLAVDVGLDAVVARNVTIGASYTGQLASHARDNAIKANLSWRF